MLNEKRRIAFVGLGSNLESPLEQIRRALTALDSIEQTELVAHSGFYTSRPMGAPDQPDYINAVAHLEISLAENDMLSRLQEIEQQQGRVRRGERWGPRTLDLDLLSVADVRLHSDELTLPHPGIAARSFVLFPWLELAPDYYVPGVGIVSQLAQRFLGTKGIERIENLEELER